MRGFAREQWRAGGYIIRDIFASRESSSMSQLFIRANRVVSNVSLAHASSDRHRREFFRSFVRSFNVDLSLDYDRRGKTHLSKRSRGPAFKSPVYIAVTRRELHGRDRRDPETKRPTETSKRSRFSISFSVAASRARVYSRSTARKISNDR